MVQFDTVEHWLNTILVVRSKSIILRTAENVAEITSRNNCKKIYKTYRCCADKKMISTLAHTLLCEACFKRMRTIFLRG